MSKEIAVFGGGCFWCIEAAFQTLPGVISAEPGYAGGSLENPSYDQVCAGATGHAEVVKVTYDSDKISYKQLLEVLFTVHDPTTPNRQGNDVGPQYRSAIYYTSEEQKKSINEFIDTLAREGRFLGVVVTEIAPLDKFWPAEDYHRDYYIRNTNAPYCRAIIRPKLDKIKRNKK
jgi:peptide-methionine (S)-S-oxide reductase